MVASVPAEVAPGSVHGAEAAVHEYLGIHVGGVLEVRQDREVSFDCLDMAGTAGSCSDGRSEPSVSVGEHIGSPAVRWDLLQCKSSRRKDEVQR